MTTGGQWVGNGEPPSGTESVKRRWRLRVRPLHLRMRLRVRAERIIIRGEAGDMGLRVLDGHPPLPWPWLAPRCGIAVADHVNVETGIAAVWVILRPYSKHPRDYLCLYERVGQRWRPVGSCGGGSVEPGLLRDRPSAATSGPAVLLTPERRSGSVVRGHGSDSSTKGQPHDDWWIVGETFQASTEVQEVRMGSERISVPRHGFFVVAWKSASIYFPSSRPLITCLNDRGVVLTRLYAGDYMHSAIIDASTRAGHRVR
jgi:hypothetical protein